jgi:hypothetical protein
MNRTLMNRLAVSALIILLLAGGVAPLRAHAQIGVGVQPVVTVPGSTVSDPAAVTLSLAYQNRQGALGSGIGLNAIAWQVAKLAIQSMTKSMVNWINSGFNGSPAFVTDLEGHLRNVGDAVAGSFLNQLLTNPAIASPFQSNVAKDVAALYYLSTSRNSFFAQSPYTLNKVTPNDAAFLGGNFKSGGLAAWHSAIFNMANNPYGARMLAVEALGANVSNAQQVALTQLGWGQGFLSWCGDNRTGANNNVNNVNAAGDGLTPVVVTSAVNPAEVCRKDDGTPGYIQTPGSVIQNQINHTLGLSGDTLVSADEFNEIIGALMSQLVNQVVGGIGLSGASSVSSGGTGYIDKATAANQSTTSTTASITQVVNAQLIQVQQYKSDWTTVMTEAQAAATASPNCAVVSPVITQGTQALQDANTAITLLTKVQTDASAAGNNAAQIAAVGAELQQALSSDSMPSATAIASIHADAQDSTDGSTVFSKMKAIATTGVCPSS